MILFFPCVVSVIIASGAEREMSMNRMCACLLFVVAPGKKEGKKYKCWLKARELKGSVLVVILQVELWSSV